jgi:hypothetical protein
MSQKNSILFIPCQVEGISTRRDKTLKVTIGTQELTPDKMAQLLAQWSEGYGVMAFKKEEFADEERKALEAIQLDKEDMGGKTPSQRLRSCLYALWESNNSGYNTFASFYESRMEQFITIVKKRIDEQNH